MSNVIDLSAATPATRNAIAEEQFGARLQQTALAQMLDVINQGKPNLNALQREAIEMLQMEGIAVAIEFLAQQCDAQENEWIKLLRTQIVEENIRRVKAAQGQLHEAAAGVEPVGNHPLDKQPATAGYLNIAVGYSPEATAENAGAIRTALLLGFIQLSQQYPDSIVEPSMARMALQWIPTEDEGDHDSAGV
jgi:hypothetical protein